MTRYRAGKKTGVRQYRRACREQFSVSPQTIRRDLNDLADQKMILRHHGGTSCLPSSSVNTSWHDRKATQTQEKERIARKVASEIPDGATLFIDIGTTPEAVAHALLNHNDLRIVTNNLNVANTLMVKEDFTLSWPVVSCVAGMAVLLVKPPSTLSLSSLDFRYSTRHQRYRQRWLTAGVRLPRGTHQAGDY